MNLTPDEKRFYGQLFQQADTDGLGVITGENAVKFFEKSKIAPNVLGEVRQSLPIAPTGSSDKRLIPWHHRSGSWQTSRTAVS